MRITRAFQNDSQVLSLNNNNNQLWNDSQTQTTQTAVTSVSSNPLAATLWKFQSLASIRCSPIRCSPISFGPSKAFMKFYLIAFFALISSFLCRSQELNLIGVFRDVDISHRAINYIEFKADSTAIIKRISLRQNDSTKKAFALNGRWKMNKDTLILDFGRVLQDSHLYYRNEPQIKLLVKDSNALYSRRNRNGKFIRDSILKKAYKVVRLRPDFIHEYNDLPD